MLRLLTVCVVLAAALAQDDVAAVHAGIERPPGFPYIPPYIHPHAAHPLAFPFHFPFFHHQFFHGYPYYHPAAHGYVYYGLLPHDSCVGAPDGLYYVDSASFAFCSNGIKTLQPCAEGAANPALESFHPGTYYTLNDFCSVNLLVDAAKR